MDRRAPGRLPIMRTMRRRNDLFLTYVIVNPQADRSKDWGGQAEELVAQIVDEDTTGLTIRGAKMLGTSSIMANEVFVANLQPLKPGEEALAFSCALPMNAAGLQRAVTQELRGACGIGLRQSVVGTLRRERCGALLRRREGAMGTRVRASRHRHVPRPVPRHSWPYLPELPGTDPAVGEAEVPGRPRAPDHRGDRHHQHAAGARTTRQPGGQRRHGGGDACRHGGLGRHARRVLPAEPASWSMPRMR